LPSGQGRSFPTAWSLPFEEVDEFAIALGDPGEGLLARRLPGFPVDKRIPEDGAADGKADEARHLAGGAEPLAHLLIVLAAAEHDAADAIASAGPGRCHDRLAILSAIEAFDLPQVGLDAGLLQL